MPAKRNEKCREYLQKKKRALALKTLQAFFLLHCVIIAHTLVTAIRPMNIYSKFLLFRRRRWGRNLVNNNTDAIWRQCRCTNFVNMNQNVNTIRDQKMYRVVFPYFRCRRPNPKLFQFIKRNGSCRLVIHIVCECQNIIEITERKHISGNVATNVNLTHSHSWPHMWASIKKGSDHSNISHSNNSCFHCCSVPKHGHIYTLSATQHRMSRKHWALLYACERERAYVYKRMTCIIIFKLETKIVYE